MLTNGLTRGGLEYASGRKHDRSGRKQRRTDREQDRSDRKQEREQDRSDRKQEREQDRSVRKQERKQVREQDRSDRKRVEDLKETNWGTSGRSNNRDYTRETRTAMLITRTDDSFRNGVFVAPAPLKRCDRFLLRRIRFCHSRAVSARNQFHRVSYGRHTLKQNMEASNGNATLSCASPRFTHTSFVVKNGDWELAVSMSS